MGKIGEVPEGRQSERLRNKAGIIGISGLELSP